MIDEYISLNRLREEFYDWLTQKLIEKDVHQAELIRERGEVVIEVCYQREDNPRPEAFGYVYEYDENYCEVVAYSANCDGVFTINEGEVHCRTLEDPERLFWSPFFGHESIVEIYDDELQAEMMAQRI